MVASSVVRRAAALVLLAGSVACGGGSKITETVHPVNLTVNNNLLSSAQLQVDGITSGTVAAGGSLIVTAQSNNTTLSFVMTKQKYGDGTNVPDDLVGGQVALNGQDASFAITNTVGSSNYFTPFINNTLSVAIDVAVTSGSGVHCLATFPAGSSGRLGYYLDSPASQVTYYNGGTSCSGSSRFWSHDVLAAHIETPTGLIRLTTDVAP
jgi:hypothetical protein